MKLRVPTTPDQITASWLTEALRSTGSIRNTSVKSFTTRRTGAEQGFSGYLVRFEVLYRNPEPSAPATFVGKFISVDASGLVSREDSFKQEVRFYQDIVPSLQMRVPRCYFSGINHDEQVGMLLLEDLTHLRAPNLVKACTESEAEMVIRHFARMHARWWGSESLGKMQWLPSINAYGKAPFHQWWADYPAVIRRLLPEYHIPDAYFEIAKRFGQTMPKIYEPLAAPPVTLVHRDAHAENFMFDHVASDSSLVVLDWELVAKARGVVDVTYFLISSLSPMLRRQVERRFLELYHGVLTGNGVEAYSFAQCWQDYRRAAFAKLMVTVAATVSYNNESKARRAWRKVDLHRLAVFIEDHNVGEFL